MSLSEPAWRERSTSRVAATYSPFTSNDLSGTNAMPNKPPPSPRQSIDVVPRNPISEGIRRVLPEGAYIVNNTPRSRRQLFSEERAEVDAMKETMQQLQSDMKGVIERVDALGRAYDIMNSELTHLKQRVDVPIVKVEEKEVIHDHSKDIDGLQQQILQLSQQHGEVIDIVNGLSDVVKIRSSPVGVSPSTDVNIFYIISIGVVALLLYFFIGYRASYYEDVSTVYPT